ncbi:glycoside hydrolase family 88 protein [bacterium]|nr:glycoside hydrolase family 88 protein [bacterium]
MVHRYRSFLIAAIFLFASFACHAPALRRDRKPSCRDALSFALSQLRRSITEIPAGRFPIRTKAQGAWELTPPETWTSGFYPGCLWLAFRLSGDSSWIQPARMKTGELKEQQFNTGTHDVGFMMMSSYGQAFLLNPNEEDRQNLLQSARSLASRFNSKAGCIQSWNGDFQVIIDNMMNLELLFWASRHGGGPDLHEIAVSHARQTIRNHLREDGGSFHVVVYDTATGLIREKRTAQGYAAGSTWARGQAWGIYGFTMCFRETGDSLYLRTALRMADYFLDHLPEDHVPFWDFNLPEDHPRRVRDASAAAIASSALLELRNDVRDPAPYDRAAERMLGALIDRYLSRGTESSGIIVHAAYNANSRNPDDWDASTIWGDYYFLEALYRYLHRTES